MSTPPALRSAAWSSAPPLVALVVASLWCGTFHGGASAAGRVALAALVLALGLLGARSWRDPLGVGGTLPLAFGVCVLASFFASPVRRAGLEAVVLLPAFGLAVAGTARCWREEAAQRWAVRGIALLVLVGSSWSVVDWAIRSAGPPTADPVRTALPLGHHNLLAAWLVALLPLASLSLRQAGGWRALGALVLVVGGAALLLSRSLAGLLAVSTLLLVRIWRRRGAMRHAALGLALLATALALAAAASRLGAVATLEDPSLRVRLNYAGGALRGAAERPALGWGPGAVRWTFGHFLEAAPGWRPAGEVVTAPHSLPLELAYDLGATGLVLALAMGALFARRRLRELEASPEEDGVRGAALLGLGGLVLVSLVGRPFSAAALPLVAVVLAGASLAPSETPARGWPVGLYTVLAAMLLVRPGLAGFEYERAMRRPGSLERAADLDPAFPLYRLHHALGLARADPGSSSAAWQAARAAREASGLSPLWLAAGLLALDAEAPYAEEALLRACALDPLGPLAPFALLQTTEPPDLLAERAARSMLADPVLGAAVLWEERRALFAQGVDLIGEWPGLPEAWRGTLVVELRRVAGRRHEAPVPPGERLVWSLEVDARQATSLALHAFRRSAWPFELGAVELDAAAAARLTVPGAAELRGTAAAAFPKERCGRPVAQADSTRANVRSVRRRPSAASSSPRMREGRKRIER